MATKNDITGDSLVSRTSEAYRNNYDAIFGKKGKKDEQEKTESTAERTQEILRQDTNSR